MDLCDSTDGLFRIGKIKFVMDDSVGSVMKDIVIWDNSNDPEDKFNNSHVPGIGSRNTRVSLFTSGGGATMASKGAISTAHELGHYVWGLRDDYGGEGYSASSPCGNGTGFFTGVNRDESNNTLMQSTSPTKCFVKPPGGDWTNTNVRCNWVEECLTDAIVQGFFPDPANDLIWEGVGATDTVRCNAPSNSELSIHDNHDIENGVGDGFDGRAGGGIWKPFAADKTRLTLLNEYTDDAIANGGVDGSGNVGLGCPDNRQTQQVTVPILMNPSGDVVGVPTPVVGDSDDVSQFETDSTAFSYVTVMDSLGKFASDEDCCDKTKDSLHRLGVFAVYTGLDGADEKYDIFFTLPARAFQRSEATCDDGEDGKDDPDCEHVVVHVEKDVVYSPNNQVFINNFSSANVGALDFDDCNMCDDKQPAEQPDALSFPITVEMTATTGVTRFDTGNISAEGAIGDCAWHTSARTCAKKWMPFNANNLQEGKWASTRQTVELGEWDWATLYRLFRTYTDDDGNEKELMQFEMGPGSLVDPWSNQCYNYQGINPAAPKGAYDVEFERFERNESITYLVVDRSGSMDTSDGSSNRKRIDNAVSAGIDYVDATKTLMDDSAWVTNLGLIRFDHVVECFGPDSDISNDVYDCEVHNVGTSADDLTAQIQNELVPRGSTALNDAVDEAAQQIINTASRTDNSPDVDWDKKMRTIFLVSDGHENASTNDDVTAVKNYLIQNNIVLYALAVGREADQDYLRALADPTGGTVVYSGSADSIANAFLDMETQATDGVLIEPLAEVYSEAEGPIVVSEFDPYEFRVRDGAKDLTILLTNAGYVDPEPGQEEEVAYWNLGFVLTAPDGTVYNRLSENVFEVENSLLRIYIPNPPGGMGEDDVWSLALHSIGRDMKSNLTISAHDPSVRMAVNADKQLIPEGEEVVFQPSISWGGVDLNVNQADCVVTVHGPGNTSSTLLLENTRDDYALGYAPKATFGNFSGRGFYRADVTCSVSANVKPVRWTPEDDSTLDIVPFEYSASTYVYYNSTQMPPCETNDCDNDGVSNDLEGTGDSDGDMWIDMFDSDSDNDDVNDFDDNCPTVNHLEVASKGLYGSSMKTNRQTQRGGLDETLLWNRFTRQQQFYFGHR